MRIDLHLHSTASDGSLSPSALVWAARAGGLDVIAITDHDTCAGVEEARRALATQLHVIPAIELSTTYQRCEQHILGYFINPKNPALVEYARGAVEKRHVRIEGMIERLKPYGITLSMSDVLANSEPGTRALGRPHLARALVQKGFVQTVSEAFERFIGDQGPAFLPTDLLEPKHGFELIHQAGGIAVWAHPRATAVDQHLNDFVEWGLDGVECYRPNATPAETLHLEQIAQSRGLFTAGGSDWHGTWQGKLGDFYVTPEEVEKLLEFGGI
ncbi:MAG: PHP domain-containing protein [Gemmatimonadota bacterium]